LHKTSNKNVLECVKCVCSHDFPARSVVHTTWGSKKHDYTRSSCTLARVKRFLSTGFMQR